MIGIIVAMDEKRGIGKNGKIPWHIPEDLKHFRQITTGHPVIMGRKTFESIGRPLPNRTNIVVTRDKLYKVTSNKSDEVTSCIVVDSLESAIKAAENVILRTKSEESPTNVGSDIRQRSFASAQDDKKKDEIFIIGGGQIYAQAVALSDKLYLTIVEGSYDADTFFPDYSAFKKIVSEEKHESDGYRYRFLELER